MSIQYVKLTIKTFWNENEGDAGNPSEPKGTGLNGSSAYFINNHTGCEVPRDLDQRS